MSQPIQVDLTDYATQKGVAVSDLKSPEVPQWLSAAMVGIRKEFNPDEPRDHGKWTSGGGVGAESSAPDAQTDNKPFVDFANNWLNTPEFKATYARLGEAQAFYTRTKPGEPTSFTSTAGINQFKPNSDITAAAVRLAAIHQLGAKVDAALKDTGISEAKIKKVSDDLQYALEGSSHLEVHGIDRAVDMAIETPGERLVNDMSNAWKESSCKDYRSVALHHAVQRVTGLDHANFPVDDLAEREAAKFDQDPEQKKILDIVARTVYDNTQDVLKRAGIKSMTLYRGMSIDASTGWGRDLMQGLEKDQLDPTHQRFYGFGKAVLNPASSFSPDFKYAARFSDGYAGKGEGQPSMLGTQVPAEQIFSCPLSGIGAVQESEFIVLGKPLQTRIVSGALPEDEKQFWALHQSTAKSFSSAPTIYPDRDRENADWLALMRQKNQMAEALAPKKSLKKGYYGWIRKSEGDRPEPIRAYVVPVASRAALEAAAAHQIGDVMSQERQVVTRMLKTDGTIPDSYYSHFQQNLVGVMTDAYRNSYLQSSHQLASALGLHFTTLPSYTDAHDWAVAKANKVAESITNTTKDRMQGVDQLTGEDRDDKLVSIFGPARTGLIAGGAVTSAISAGEIATGKKWNQLRELGVLTGALAALAMSSIWMVEDEDACDICQELDGTNQLVWEVDYPEGPGDDGPHIGCILPGNLVVPMGEVSGGTKAFYRGSVVEITLASGRRLSCTPNHPILTPGGWVAAELLGKGSDVVCTRDAVKLSSLIEPDNNNMPTPIEQVFSSLGKKTGVTTARVPVTSKQFHGDARLFDGNIDVVNVDSPLLRYRQTPFLQLLSQRVFSRGDAELQSLRSLGSHTMFGNCGFASLGSGVGVSEHIRALFLGRLLPTKKHGFRLSPRSYSGSGESRAKHTSGNSKFLSEALFGFSSTIPFDNRTHIINLNSQPSANLDAGRLQSSADNRVRESKLAIEFVDRFASDITTDYVTQVRRFNFAGHVYDLQCEKYALYTVDGIVVHNCRCRTESYLYGTDRPFEDLHHETEDYVDQRIQGDTFNAGDVLDNPDIFSVSQAKSVRPWRIASMLHPNNYYGIRKEYQKQHLGAWMLGNEVKKATDAGLKYIDTQAVGSISSAQNKQWAGYITWPTLGYDAPIPYAIRDEAKQSFPKAKTVLDVLKEPGGKDWYLQHGVGTNMKFDLTPGSRSHQVLDNYLKARGIDLDKPLPIKGLSKSFPSKDALDWEPDLEGLDELVAFLQSMDDTTTKPIQKGYDPDEDRDDHGRWSGSGGGSETSADTATLNEPAESTKPTRAGRVPSLDKINEVAHKLRTHFTALDLDNSVVVGRAMTEGGKRVPVVTIQNDPDIRSVMQVKFTPLDVRRASNTCLHELTRMSKLFPPIQNWLNNRWTAEADVRFAPGDAFGVKGDDDSEGSKPAAGVCHNGTGRITVAGGLKPQMVSEPQIGTEHVGDSLPDVFRHEFGHRFFFKALSTDQQDHWWNNVSIPVLKDNYNVDFSHPDTIHFTIADLKPGHTVPVSNYAMSDPRELFAESFSAYTHPNYKRGSLPPQIEEFLDQTVGGKRNVS